MRRSAVHAGIKSPSCLTLGEFILLLQRPEIWARMNLIVDRTLFTNPLHEVREIRNEVMHFDRDRMTDTQLRTLKRAAHFMRELNEQYNE